MGLTYYNWVGSLFIGVQYIDNQNKNIFIRIPAERAFLDPGDTPQFAGGGAELIKGTRQKIYDHP